MTGASIEEVNRLLYISLWQNIEQEQLQNRGGAGECTYLGSCLPKDFSLSRQGMHSQVHGSRSYVGMVEPPPSCPSGSREHRLEVKAGITFKKPTPSGLLLPARFHLLSALQHSKAVNGEPVKNILECSNSNTRPVTGNGFEAAIQVNLWQMGTRVVPETGPLWERERACLGETGKRQREPRKWMLYVGE